LVESYNNSNELKYTVSMSTRVRVKDAHNAGSKVPGDDRSRQSNNISHPPCEIQQQAKVAKETTGQRYSIQNDFPIAQSLSITSQAIPARELTSADLVYQFPHHLPRPVVVHCSVVCPSIS
jgi:hypothetical protein